MGDDSHGISRQRTSSVVESFLSLDLHSSFWMTSFSHDGNSPDTARARNLVSFGIDMAR